MDDLAYELHSSKVITDDLIRCFYKFTYRGKNGGWFFDIPADFPQEIDKDQFIRRHITEWAKAHWNE